MTRSSIIIKCFRQTICGWTVHNQIKFRKITINSAYNESFETKFIHYIPSPLYLIIWMDLASEILGSPSYSDGVPFSPRSCNARLNSNNWQNPKAKTTGRTNKKFSRSEFFTVPKTWWCMVFARISRKITKYPTFGTRLPSWQTRQT